MAQPDEFAAGLERAEALTHRWQLGPALLAAERLVDRFSTEPRAHTLHHLLVCLTDGGRCRSGLLSTSEGLIKRAMREVPDFPPVAQGDMLRDQLLGLVRFGHNLEVAAVLPDQIKWLHDGDANRLACLTDARARLAAAQDNLFEAYRIHSEAHKQWQALPQGEADPNWVHFNLVHWLRVSIELYGRRHEKTKRILALLASSNPEGGHGRRQIRIICLPFVGPRVYKWMETHRLL